MIWLLVWAALTRLPYLFSSTLLFGFDHGRDALAALNFVKSFDLFFVGPPTSIPGLFVGPGWYYFLSLANFIGRGNPLAGAWLMFFLFLGAIALAYKFLGAFEAIILTLAPIWTQLATGVQSPHPIPILALLLIIALIKGWPAVTIGVIIGLGFHFDSALAVFWVLLVPCLIKLKQWPKLMLGGFITFIPQLLFELKHSFSQTRAVIDYFAAGESQHLTPGKIVTVTQSVFHELELAVLPDIFWLKIISLVILLVGTIYVIRKKEFDFWPKILLLTIIPMIGFWFLHYNPWYSYGLLPLAVVASGKILRSLPKPLAWLFLFLLFLNSAAKLKQFIVYDRQFLAQHKGFLTAKMAALDYIYSQAGNRPFASYHYHPEIYDYAYQYLYIWQAFKDKPLPVNFSYQPNVPVYINEKAGLLNLLPAPAGPAQITFLIIEKPDNIWHYPFESWLKHINYSEVVEKKVIGPELEVWQVIP